jgi:hypothetical protein
MIKLKLLAAAIALLMISSLAISGSSGDAKPAQEILNKMACNNKKSGEQVKDQTSGKMIICPMTKK